MPTIAFTDGTRTRNRASRALRLRSPRDTPLPLPMNVLLLRWDTKPDKRIRRTFLRPASTRRTSFYAADRASRCVTNSRGARRAVYENAADLRGTKVGEPSFSTELGTVTDRAATRLRLVQVDAAVAICARPLRRSRVTGGRRGRLLEQRARGLCGPGMPSCAPPHRRGRGRSGR